MLLQRRQTTNRDLVWLAGLLEGEGSFSLHTVAGKNYGRILLNMTDRDVVERARDVIGAGRIHLHHKANRKPLFMLTVCGVKALSCMNSLLPYMGERRSRRIKEVLDIDARTRADRYKVWERKRIHEDV